MYDKDIGIRKSKFVAKATFLCKKKLRVDFCGHWIMICQQKIFIKACCVNIFASLSN